MVIKTNINYKGKTSTTDTTNRCNNILHRYEPTLILAIFHDGLEFVLSAKLFGGRKYVTR